MGLITLDLPVIGQPNTTEDPKIRNDFQTLQNVINGNIDGANLSPGLLSQLGSIQKIITAIQVQDVGNSGQLRAGRILTPADFTNMGLSAPAGLWNLSNLNDASGNNRNLQNKGAVTFASGITGAGSEAAQFIGSTTQALYIVDTGAADPFRIRTGSIGCWFRTAKRGTQQSIISKYATAGQNAWNITITTNNNIQTFMSSSGSDAYNINGTLDVCDDRWHFLVLTHDSGRARLYIDGVLDGNLLSFGGGIFQGSSPLNIGGQGADGSVAAAIPFFGRVDEAFVTGDVLSQEQILNLYCAAFTHTLGSVPSGTRMVTRRRRRGLLTSANFPSQPVRLHNFTGGSLADEGSGAVPLTNGTPTQIISIAGADGVNNGGFHHLGGGQGLTSTDAGLPSGTASRSYGCWFKSLGVTMGFLGWGTVNTGEALLDFSSTGAIRSLSSADVITGPVINDGFWHFACVTEDNAPVDGVKRRLYVDGKCVGSSVTLNSITLVGANRFRVGARTDGTLPTNGAVDAAFVFAGVLTPEQVRTLYNAGSQQLGPSPKASEDHIEALELTRVLGRFDTIEGSDLIDLSVIA